MQKDTSPSERPVAGPVVAPLSVHALHRGSVLRHLSPGLLLPLLHTMRAQPATGQVARRRHTAAGLYP